MDRKKFGAVLDETVSKMEHDVRILKNQSVTLKTNIQELEKMRDNLSSEIAKLEAERTKVIKETKDKTNSMLAAAQEKLNKATTTDTTASKKLSELNKKTEDYEKLIKSNEGLKNNLETRIEKVEIKSNKLSELSEIINKTIKEL